MTNSERYPSYAACVAHALSTSSQPLTVDALLAKVERQRPLTKGARSAVYRAIHKLFQAVPVAPGRYGWLSHLLAGATVRHSMISEEVRRGYFLLDELEHVLFFPQFFQTHRLDGRVVAIELFGGATVQVEASIERKTWALRLGNEFTEWIEELGGQNRDDIIIIVKDALAGHYTMRLQPREMRDDNTIQNRNIQLALLAEEIVAEDRQMRPAMPAGELAARLIARGFFSDPLPPDELHFVLHQYSLLRFDPEYGYYLESVENDRIQTSSLSPSGLPSAELAERLFGAAMDIFPDPDDGWLNVTDATAEMDYPWNTGVEEDTCEAYDAYINNFYNAKRPGAPLPHEDFHLLEAELESLLALEYEFGRLLPEQEARKQELAEYLFIDPESLFDDGMDEEDYLGDDDDGYDDDDDDYNDDYDGPPFWRN
jgi:hypothetical protein